MRADKPHRISAQQQFGRRCSALAPCGLWGAGLVGEGLRAAGCLLPGETSGYLAAAA